MFLLIACRLETFNNIEKVVRVEETSFCAKITSQASSLTFKNENIYRYLSFNLLNYPIIMACSGVATGDVDNDGLIDVFFGSNFGLDVLYKNMGDFIFQDVSAAASVTGNDGFTTGVTMFDVNIDGHKDLIGVAAIYDSEVETIRHD